MIKTAIMFPGQGSQYAGMGKTICNEHQAAKQTFEEADEYLGFELSKLCFEGSNLELNRVENMFPAILTASVALFRVYMNEIGITPLLTAGHSLGEYSALVCSGIMEFKDAVKIARLRGELACDARYTDTGTMTVINGISKEIIENECKKVNSKGYMVGISCYNSTDQIVVSGKNDGVMELEDRVIELGAQITPMLMSPPMHSPLMKAASERMREELKACCFGNAKWPVISNVNALPYEKGTDNIIRNLVNQLIMPVRWLDIMKYIEAYEIDSIIEMGNQAVLTNIAKMNNPKYRAFSFGQKDDRNALMQEISNFKDTGDKPGENHISCIIPRCMAIAVSVPNSNWDNGEYIKGVEEPYERIESIQDELDKKNKLPANEQIQEVLAALKVILDTKGISHEEQQVLFNELHSLM